MAKKKQQGESIAGYFRKLFEQHPEWLEQKSNDAVLAKYREDHNLAPDAQVEKRVKDAMANTKSQMRKKKKEAGAGRGRGRPGRKPGMAASTAGTRMEALEEQIDDCLTLARTLDREGLEEVIKYLRRARNAVVWKMGQPDGRS